MCQGNPAVPTLLGARDRTTTLNIRSDQGDGGRPERLIPKRWAFVLEFFYMTIRQEPVLRSLAISLAILLFFQGVSFATPIFYVFPWFDIPMHILGGMTLGFFGILIHAGIPALRKKPHAILMIVLLCGLIGGIGWELVEFNLDRFVGSALQTTMIDTIGDLFCDVFGAYLAYLLSRNPASR